MKQKITRLRHVYVEFIPESLEPGCLFISRRFSTASHLCCCGCGTRVVTPLNPAKWRLTDHGATVSLHPSIGNWSFPCRSHYIVDHGFVRWAGAMSEHQIALVRRKDSLDAKSYVTRSNTKKQMQLPDVERVPVQTNSVSDVDHGSFLSRLGNLVVRWFTGK